MIPFRLQQELTFLNAKLNPICHLLALLGAHHILHVSRLRANTTYEEIPFIIKTIKLDGIRTPHHPARSLVTTLTELNLLLFYGITSTLSGIKKKNEMELPPILSVLREFLAEAQS